MTVDVPLILAVAGDPGGANALAPVIERLRSDSRVSVRALAYRQAGKLWRQRGLACEDLSEDIFMGAVSSFFKQKHPSLLLTGTSANGVDLEKQFVAQARHMRVPSVAVLDFWTNYALRFADADGLLSFLPDRIAVMDEQARSEMLAAGFESARIVVTGQPAFDDLRHWREGFSEARRAEVRTMLGLKQNQLFVLFASQPLSSLYGTDPFHPHYQGYHEEPVLDMLVKALEQIARKNEVEVVLVIRPHPREKVEAFTKRWGSSLPISVYTDGESCDLVMAADLVVGMTTVLLVEACYLGCLTVSLQPELRFPDSLPTNRLGLSRAVYTTQQIAPVIEEMLLDEMTRKAARARLAHLAVDTDATRRVVDLAYEMIGFPQV
jgi:hypothetical protein